MNCIGKQHHDQKTQITAKNKITLPLATDGGAAMHIQPVDAGF